MWFLDIFRQSWKSFPSLVADAGARWLVGDEVDLVGPPVTYTEGIPEVLRAQDTFSIRPGGFTFSTMTHTTDWIHSYKVISCFFFVPGDVHAVQLQLHCFSLHACLQSFNFGVVTMKDKENGHINRYINFWRYRFLDHCQVRHNCEVGHILCMKDEREQCIL